MRLKKSFIAHNLWTTLAFFSHSVQSAHIFPSSILGLCLAPLDWILVEPDRFRAAEYQPYCVHYYTRHYVPSNMHTARFEQISFHSLSFSLFSYVCILTKELYQSSLFIFCIFTDQVYKQFSLLDIFTNIFIYLIFKVTKQENVFNEKMNW